MYHIVSVCKLSDTQKSRLRNGHATRIKKGNGNKLHLTAEQIKKLESAHKKKRGYTLTMHPEQAEKHGSGIFGDIATKLKQLAVKHKHIINPLIKGAKATAHRGIAKLASSAHNKVDNLIQPVDGGAVKRRRGRPKRGEGIIGDVLKGIIGVTGVGVKPKRTRKTTTTRKGKGVIGDVLKGLIGVTGVGVKPKSTRTRKTKTTRKGKGVISDLAKSGLKALAPVIIDAAANAAKNKVSGMGARKRRPGRPRKIKVGSALYPA